VELSSISTSPPKIPRKQHAPSISQEVNAADENFDIDMQAANDFIPPESDAPPVSKHVCIEEIEDEDTGKATLCVLHSTISSTCCRTTFELKGKAYKEED